MGETKQRIHPKLLQLLKQLKYNSLGFFFLSFITPIIAYHEFNANGFEMAILFSINIVGSMLSSPFAGILSDDKNVRPHLILGGSIGRMVAYEVIYGGIILRSYWLMVGGTFFLGLGTSFFWVPLQTILSDATEYKYRSEAFGVYSQQIGMGVFFGATFGFFIFGWASGTGGGSALMYSPLLIYGVVNVYGGLRALKLAPMVPLLELPAEHTDSFTEHQEEDSNSFGDTLFWLSLIFLFAIVFLEQMIGSLVAPFLEVFLLKYISGDPMNIAIAYAPGAVLSFVLAPKMGKIADKINPRYWLASTSALGALTTWFLVNSTELWQFTMLFIVDSTVISSAGLVLSKIISDVSKTRRGSVFGTQGGVSNFGAIAGPVMGGILWELIGDRAPFLLSIGVEAFLAVVYLVSISYILTQLKGRTEEKRETPYVPPLLR